MDQPNLNEVLQTIQDTARLGDKPHVELVSVNADLSVPVAFVADGPGKVKAVSLLPFIEEAGRSAAHLRLSMAVGPDRRKGMAEHQTLSSFIAHLQRFKDEHSAVWADADGQEARLVGVFNYHETGAKGTPRWGDHRAEYPCPLSAAWKAWGAGNQLNLTQDGLAIFLDAHDYELAQGTLPNSEKSPPPSALLTMANTLETYSSATVKRERDPKTGRITLALTDDRGVANAAPPPSFLILIPIFEDSEAELLEVRLRVTVEKDGKAHFTLQIHDAERKWRASYQKVISEVITRTGLPVYEGTPE